MMRFTLILLIFLIGFSNYVPGQTKGFNTYSDPQYLFSFDIPAQWKIEKDTGNEESDFTSICRPITKKEIKTYKECFEGIVFYVIIYNTDLDKTLKNEQYRKYNDIYYTTDRLSDSVKTENIKGKNWQGIYHNNVCGITCKETGFHAAAGQCEYFYFSNGKNTICITTNGRKLDVDVKNKLLKTFTFN